MVSCDSVWINIFLLSLSWLSSAGSLNKKVPWVSAAGGSPISVIASFLTVEFAQYSWLNGGRAARQPPPRRWSCRRSDNQQSFKHPSLAASYRRWGAALKHLSCKRRAHFKIYSSTRLTKGRHKAHAASRLSVLHRGNAGVFTAASPFLTN